MSHKKDLFLEQKRGIPPYIEKQLRNFGYKGEDTFNDFENALNVAEIIFDNSIEGIILTTANLRIQKVNKTFSEVTGYSSEDVIGKTPSLLQSGQHGNEFYKDMWDTLNEKGIWQRQIFNRKKNGEIYPEWLTIRVIKNSQGEIVNYLGLFTDLTSTKITQDTIHHLAYYDPLTNLPNRLLFTERLKQNITFAQRQYTRLALLFIDLDGFKKINDSLGHNAGDVLLQDVALRLKNSVRESDTVSRLGGDEFTVILNGYNDPNDIPLVLEKILKEISSEFTLGEHKVYISASIGISVYPEDGTDMVELIKNADTSMYAAKEKGKNRYEFYDAEMNRKILERLTLESCIHIAYDQEQFSVHYQPKINLNDHNVYGAEALIRWNHPTYGFISPSRFIPLAEEIGMIVPIGEWVLRQTCRSIKDWRERGAQNIKISVNLSSLQFRDPNLITMLETMIIEEGVDAASLEIEITESMLMHDVQGSIEMMKRLKAMGVSLSIDDFGTGYSSLKYLKQFPIDTLKIDKSFIDDIATDINDRMLTKSIIDLADNLGLRVIAEGVETIEQIEFLAQNGCSNVQGFYFSQAVDADTFYDFAVKFNSDEGSKTI